MLVLALWDSLARAQQRARTSRRLVALLAGYLVLTLVMGWRLVSVQLVDAEVYAGWAHAQTQREVALPATRGALTDREGDPLAMSLAASTIFANPPVLAEAGIDPYVIADRLAAVVPGADPERLVESLTSDRSFVYLGRQLPRDVGEAVMALELPGVGVLEEPTRVYPADRIASQVIGWAGLDGEGLAGLELQYEDALGGEDGTLRLEEAPGGVEISAAPREVLPATPGVDVRLTIDREVQFATEEILADAVESYEAIGGSAVVMDTETGEILAMASVPSVAPDEFAAAEPYDRRNRALTDVFEPGSVNKVIAIAGALEDGVVDADQGFDVPAQISIGPETFSDSEPHPTAWWSTRDIITRSSNVGTIQIARQLGEERLYDYVTDFGLGQPTGLSFPGESRGLLAPVSEWTSSSLPTIAIGQGVAATLVQTAQVFAVIANDGEYRAPSLVQGTVDGDGVFTPAEEPERRQVVSPDTARTVADMLVQVVEAPEGTGNLAAVDGYRVGGKTGTAQKPSETSRGYEEGAYLATFAGFAPVEDPRVVVAVMLDEPTPYYGGLSAAPTFSRIMEFALRDQRIPPAGGGVPLPAGHRLGNSMAVDRIPVPEPTAPEATEPEATEPEATEPDAGAEVGGEGG
ncbi:peptidoglycan D,D-transpeptidase FtsI family protein [Euzebya sp.]|uniref:peptidoglycan D,D-transpeptidase FtsI family protein n=1 Tax=Euzebya sp. TaxID=1971409 RepID=UPI00351496DC